MNTPCQNQDFVDLTTEQSRPYILHNTTTVVDLTNENCTSSTTTTVLIHVQTSTRSYNEQHTPTMFCRRRCCDRKT